MHVDMVAEVYLFRYSARGGVCVYETRGYASVGTDRYVVVRARDAM